MLERIEANVITAVSGEYCKDMRRVLYQILRQKQAEEFVQNWSKRCRLISIRQFVSAGLRSYLLLTEILGFRPRSSTGIM